MICTGCPHRGDLTVACRRPVCPTRDGLEFILVTLRRSPEQGDG